MLSPSLMRFGFATIKTKKQEKLESILLISNKRYLINK